MTRNIIVFSLLLPALVALSGCSSKPPAEEAKKAEAKTERLVGKAQVLVDKSGGATSDSPLNAGGPSVYLWVGAKRYRLFSRTQAAVEHGKEYAVEGIDAQKMIDEIGDPSQGQGGYPLMSSCTRVVRAAWPGMSFDDVDVKASVLRNRIARYPARTVFLVTKLEPAPPEEKKPAAAPDAKTIDVPAAKQSALLEQGPVKMTAPLFEPAGGTAKCKVVIDTEGKVSELETGSQLCEYVPWAQFKYKPTLQGGKPVNVTTEVEITYEARK